LKSSAPVTQIHGATSQMETSTAPLSKPTTCNEHCIFLQVTKYHCSSELWS